MKRTAGIAITTERMIPRKSEKVSRKGAAVSRLAPFGEPEHTDCRPASPGKKFAAETVDVTSGEVVEELDARSMPCSAAMAAQRLDRARAIPPTVLLHVRSEDERMADEQCNSDGEHVVIVRPGSDATRPRWADID